MKHFAIDGLTALFFKCNENRNKNEKYQYTFREL